MSDPVQAARQVEMQDVMDDGQPPMSSLVLVRHGETTWNREGRVQGVKDSPLSTLGVAQAEATAEVLAMEDLAGIWCSDLGRTQATAAALVRRTGLAPTLDPRLRERCYGILEGWTYGEIETRFPAEFARLNSRDPHYVPEGGESAMQFQARVLDVMADIARRAAGARVAVITHGGVVGIMYRHVRGMALDARRDYPLLNASINRFRMVDGRWNLDTWGDVSHLDGIPRDDRDPAA